MAGLVEAQAFGVGPVEHAAGHRGPVVVRDELHVLGAALGLDELEQAAQRNAHPRDHHRPALHAAHPVDALLGRHQLQQLVDAEAARLVHQALDAQRPRRGLEPVDVFGGVALVGAELVEIVVGGHRAAAGGGFGGAQRAGGEGAEGRRRVGGGHGQRRGRGEAAGLGEEVAPASVNVGWRDFGGQDVGGAADQHGVLP